MNREYRSSEGSIGMQSAAESRRALLVLMAAPRGFCAGVNRAIGAVTAALDRHGPPVYVRRAIVHNRTVVRDLESQGAVFVEELDEVPRGAVVILSAHGVARSVIAEAERLGLRWFDAVCPLVAKIHKEVIQSHADGRHVILIGHKGHPEIIGTLGQVPQGGISVVNSVHDIQSLSLPNDATVSYAVQTTYSVEEAGQLIAALKMRFSDIRAPKSDDICYATTNRQAAARMVASEVDAMIVAGERFSSNANRLVEVVKASGCPSVQLVADSSEIDWSLLANVEKLGVTAAASTPECSVTEIISALRSRFALMVKEVAHVTETVRFRPVSVR